ncbi:MAG: hypothetical protein H6636_02370 [Anaerolineales bacterium]|nr:hypothetical protein [Anaerolineales bacterium]
MSDKAPARPQSRSKSTEEGKTRSFLWVGVGIAALIFVAVAIIVWRQTAFPISFIGGEGQAIVLLRNTSDVEYDFQYAGKNPASVEFFLVQLESPDGSLHVDVQQVTIVTSAGEVVLDESGHAPEGTELLIQPGETFKARITYYGDTIGAHYVYGFRLGYRANGVYNENTLNIKDREFIVSVE